MSLKMFELIAHFGNLHSLPNAKGKNYYSIYNNSQTARQLVNLSTQTLSLLEKLGGKANICLVGQ
jgi:hypothetical protein